MIRLNNMLEAKYYMLEHLANCDNYFIYITQTEPCIVIGEDDVNNDIENISVYRFKTRGGTICISEGDIGISAYADRYTDRCLFESIAKNLVKYLKEKNINAEYIDNDVLVDGYKVCAISPANLVNDKEFFIFQISINTDIDLIKRVCSKEMKKEPRGLSYWGITTEDIVNWLESNYHYFNV